MITIKIKRETMNKTKEVYAMDRYKEYETRSVNPQECNPAPTITIAHHKVTMEDMFKRPEYVSELKYLQGLLDEVNNQVVDLLTQGRKPTAVLMNHKAYKVIREHAGQEVYYPVYESLNNPSDRLMGLDIAILQSASDTPYLRVVV